MSTKSPYDRHEDAILITRDQMLALFAADGVHPESNCYKNTLSGYLPEYSARDGKTYYFDDGAGAPPTGNQGRLVDLFASDLPESASFEEQFGRAVLNSAVANTMAQRRAPTASRPDFGDQVAAEFDRQRGKARDNGDLVAEAMRLPPPRPSLLDQFAADLPQKTKGT